MVYLVVSCDELTPCWDILMILLNDSLKGHADTRWLSKGNSIATSNWQISEVTKVLKIVAIASDCADTFSTANNSLIKKTAYVVLFMLSVWHDILTHITKVNKALQAEGILVSHASKIV
jgi:hypothetical protein